MKILNQFLYFFRLVSDIADQTFYLIAKLVIRTLYFIDTPPWYILIDSSD